uniref:BHLH domain-containing protein n=1 Tax=Caenorhabditis japonica TaxID=281687 RepID=A0A8R1DZK9_CAEJA
MTKTEGKVNLTTNQRFAIARGREQGRTLRQLAEQFKVDRSTFGKFLKRWTAQNRQPGKRRRSRAPVTNHQTDRNIVRASRSNPRLSAPEVLDHVSPRGSPVASVRTIRRRLNDAGMFGRRPVKKPYISDRNRAARVAWARAHLNWTQTFSTDCSVSNFTMTQMIEYITRFKTRYEGEIFKLEQQPHAQPAMQILQLTRARKILKAATELIAMGPGAMNIGKSANLQPDRTLRFYFILFFNMVRATHQASAPTTSPVVTVSKTRKEKSREKEFRRAQSINGAFENLQQHIPYLKPEERRQLPKIKTLRLAMQYINHLTQLLEGNKMHKTECEEVRPLQHSDFRSTVACEMRVRNSYRERAHMQEMDEETVKRILAREEQRSRRGHVEVPGYAPQPFGTHFTNYNFRQMEANQFDPQSQEVLQLEMTQSIHMQTKYYYAPVGQEYQHHHHVMEENFNNYH